MAFPVHACVTAVFTPACLVADSSHAQVLLNAFPCVCVCARVCVCVCVNHQVILSSASLGCSHNPSSSHGMQCSFAEESEISFGQRGFDRVRGTVIGKTNIKLQYFEEVFTSQHWMMRIYRCAHFVVSWPYLGRSKVTESEGFSTWS